MTEEQKPNIHIGLCGLCGGNVTHQNEGMPRCEQCGAEFVGGLVLPMKEKDDAVQVASATELDVREQASDGETLGSGDAEEKAPEEG